MSGISETATVTLYVNGAQAKKVMADLSNQIEQTKEKIRQMKEAGADPKAIEKVKRQLKTLQKQLSEAQSATQGLTDLFGNLDSATPRQLEKGLRTLNKQLKDMTPGSEVWQSHVEKIKELKSRLAEVREELQEQETVWDKFRNWINNSGAALVAIFLGFDQAVSTLRGYVDTYAGMEQEMANVRKYTGMTQAQVEDLNEEFKDFDTRSTREQLNMLAQEAGRLGKTSKEDILGFVRAADKVNVALDDLGKGATLVLSKIASIFGVEELYGTEQALLKAGSVINELSQNCSASAPYIANFTERMAGVGVQADMTIPQIMGFAAVLDASAQPVEASATALSQVLVRLYQEPAKYAEVAGLEVESFTKLLKEDANSALILFLDTLQKAGGMDVLSPMFKDMGETGSRAISALSTLATHIDMVKAQQEAANIAFDEGKSIDIEFAVQNNTVQSSLDKCRNAAHELQVELGERLYPLMQHFMSTGSAVMRGLLTTVRFLSEHKATIATLTVATLAYVAALKLQELWIKRVAVETAIADKATKLYTVATKALSGVIAVARLGWAALTNTLAYFRNGLQVTYTMQEKWRKSMAAMKFSTWTGLILALGTALYMLYKRFSEVSEAEKMMTKIKDEAIGKMGEEKIKIENLVKAAQDETLSLDERRKIIAKLNAMIPDYNAQLDETTGKYTANKEALDKYLDSLTRKYELEGAREQLQNLGREKAKATVARDQVKEQYDKSVEYSQSGNVPTYTTSWGSVGNVGIDQAKSLKSELDAREHELQKIVEKERKLLASYGLQIAVDDEKELEANQSPETPKGVEPPTTDNGQPKTSPDRFASEKAWREQQEAEARIAYAQGIDTYTEYTLRMKEISEEYNQMLLDRDDLTADERLKTQADYWESVNSLFSAGTKFQVEQENKDHEATLARLQQQHTELLDEGELSAEQLKNAEKVHQEAIELLQLEHLRKLVDMYKEGSDEKLKAQKALNDAELAAARRHRQEMESLEAQYAKMKADWFGDNPQESQEKYDRAFQALQVVYNRELLAAEGNASEKLRIEKAFLDAQAALRKQYNLDSEADTRGSLQRAVESSVEWLNSDGGKAVTGTANTLISGMSSIFSGLSTMVQAELQVQTAAIESRYDKEIQMAEGNSYRVAKLEKQKEAEIAKAKNDANRKMFAMQVIQAVAQTATNALNAYGSAAAIPVVGHVLAPIAAGMAVAAGMIQVAAIKKQQQASQAQGYSEGGFTKPGAVDEPAGIVHAGEWVASQKLLASPVARPMIEALDYAQRTNTIGSLRSEDVSRSITATQSLSMIAQGDPSAALMVSAVASNAGAISRLLDRLNEPFVTVNTVTGDTGIKQAEDEYTRLMNNKSPKSRRNANNYQR